MEKMESSQLPESKSNLSGKTESILWSVGTTNDLTSFEDHLDKLYGLRETSTRKAFEEAFERFKIGLLLQEAQKESGLMQNQPA